MKLIIPMAGLGTRMRPHTLTTLKPLIPIAGKPVIQHLIEELIKFAGDKVTDVAYILRKRDNIVEKQLRDLSKRFGIATSFYVQNEPLGTAHALYCAKEMFSNEVIIAYSDTIFRGSFTINKDYDSTIWVKKVKNPESFGVIRTDGEIITEFVEKPKSFVSDLAIIGIYYFKRSEELMKEIDYLIHNNIQVKGEYQLTDALENLKLKGYKYSFGEIDTWLDCGTIQSSLHANKTLLDIDRPVVDNAHNVYNSIVLEPCFIDDDVVLKHSIIGPHVSIQKNATIEHSIVSHSIINEHSGIYNKYIRDSVIGKHVTIDGQAGKYNLGDYSQSI
jgi:glucose-1-phosphate thymidylyltransferase